MNTLHENNIYESRKQISKERIKHQMNYDEPTSTLTTGLQQEHAWELSPIPPEVIPLEVLK